MPRTDAAPVDIPAAETIEGGVAFTAYFADQEPIDGGLHRRRPDGKLLPLADQQFA